MKKDDLLEELLSAWEETYKKGQLTLWIFLALKEGKKYVEEISAFIETYSMNTMTCEAQTLYRSLRKFKHIGVVDFEPGEGHKGPDRKYYYLTDLGHALLNKFTERNIHLFYTPEIKNLMDL